jgi:predicted metal-dependent phosphoesterase TrpH
MAIPGVLHVHSTYSDGEFSLRELRETLQREGCRFAGLGDHVEAFDTAKLADYLRECDDLSDAQFWFLPGLEFECERRIHVVGYGCTQLCAAKTVAEVITHIRCTGGVPVVAHPADDLLDWFENIATLPDGLEVWNSKYDGHYGPRARTFRLLRHWRARTPVLAFYGVDLHWKKQHRALRTVMLGASGNRASLLDALRRGQFQGRLGEIQLPATGDANAKWLRRADVRNRWSQRARRWFKRSKRVLDRFGLRIPRGLKSELRRWL